MAETRRILVATALPPLVIDPARARPARRTDPLPRLGRLAWLLAAFSLPALGLTLADLVHREDGAGVSQAVAPHSPLGGATTDGATRALPGVRVALPEVRGRSLPA